MGTVINFPNKKPLFDDFLKFLHLIISCRSTLICQSMRLVIYLLIYKILFYILFLYIIFTLYIFTLSTNLILFKFCIYFTLYILL